MKTIKKTKDYTIFQKGSGRYAIKGANKKWINADDKVKILVDEKLLKIKLAAPKEEPTPEATEAPTEETPAKEEAAAE